jgi:hypothetical protein
MATAAARRKLRAEKAANDLIAELGEGPPVVGSWASLDAQLRHSAHEMFYEFLMREPSTAIVQEHHLEWMLRENPSLVTMKNFRRAHGRTSAEFRGRFMTLVPPKKREGFMVAISQIDAEALKNAIEMGLDPHKKYKDLNNQSLLHKAISSKSYAHIHVLVRAGSVFGTEECRALGNFSNRQIYHLIRALLPHDACRLDYPPAQQELLVVAHGWLPLAGIRTVADFYQINLDAADVADKVVWAWVAMFNHYNTEVFARLFALPQVQEAMADHFPARFAIAYKTSGYRNIADEVAKLIAPFYYAEVEHDLVVGSASPRFVDHHKNFQLLAALPPDYPLDAGHLDVKHLMFVTDISLPLERLFQRHSFEKLSLQYPTRLGRAATDKIISVFIETPRVPWSPPDHWRFCKQTRLRLRTCLLLSLAPHAALRLHPVRALPAQLLCLVLEFVAFTARTVHLEEDPDFSPSYSSLPSSSSSSDDEDNIQCCSFSSMSPSEYSYGSE